MKIFDSFDKMKEQDPQLYNTITALMNDARYVNCGGYYDFKNEGKKNFRFVSDNWDYLTPGQYKKLFCEAMYRESAGDRSLKKYLSQIHYNIETVKIIEFGTYYVPNGKLSGWLNGMFIGIDKDGNIYT